MPRVQLAARSSETIPLRWIPDTLIGQMLVSSEAQGFGGKESCDATFELFRFMVGYS